MGVFFSFFFSKEAGTRGSGLLFMGHEKVIKWDAHCVFCVSDVIFIRLFEFVDSRFIAGGCQVFEKFSFVAQKVTFDCSRICTTIRNSNLTFIINVKLCDFVCLGDVTHKRHNYWRFVWNYVDSLSWQITPDNPGFRAIQKKLSKRHFPYQFIAIGKENVFYNVQA